jgi:uncharacterized repeat protein (TIGR02059 family)
VPARRSHIGSSSTWRAILALGLVALVAAVFFAAFTRNVAEAGNSCVWTGTTSGDWNVATNWSTCGGVTPTSADDVVFNTSVTNCPATDGGGTRTINTITVTAVFACTTGGTANTVKRTGNLTIGSTAATGTVVTVSGKTLDVATITTTVLGDVAVSGGIYKLGTTTISATTGGATGSVSVTGGTFDANAGSQAVAGNVTANGGIVQKSSGNTTTSQFTITGNVTVGTTAGSSFLSNGAGGLVVNGTATIGTNATVTESSTGLMTFNGTVSQTGGTITNSSTSAASSMNFNALYTLNGGTFATTGSNATTNMPAGWTYTSGTVTGTNGTVVFGGANDTTVSLASAVSLKNVTFASSDTKIVTINGANGQLTATGTLAFTDGLVKKGLSTGTLISTAGITEGCNFDGGDIPLSMTGTAAQVVTGPVSCANNFSLPPLTIAKSGAGQTSFNNLVRTTNPVTLTTVGTNAFGGSGSLILAGTSTFTNNLPVTKAIPTVQIGDALSTPTITVGGSLLKLDATNLVLFSGLLNAGASSITGDLTQGSAFGGGTTSITLAATGGTETITGPASCTTCDLPPVTVSITGGNLTITGNPRTSKDFLISGVGGTFTTLANPVISLVGTQTFTMVPTPVAAPDIQIGDANGTANVTVNAGSTVTARNLNVAFGSINTTSTETMNVSGNITEGAASTGGTLPVTLNAATGTQTITGPANSGACGSCSLPPLTVNQTGTAALTIAQYLRLTRGLTVTGLGSGAFTSTGSTLALGATQTVAGTNVGTQSWNNVTAEAGTITLSNPMSMTGTLTLTDGSLNTGTLSTTGDITQASTYDGGTGTIALIKGSGTQTLTGSANSTTGDLPNIEINASGATAALAGTIRTSKNWTYTAGTLDAGTSTLVSNGATFFGSQTLKDVDVRAASTISTGNLTVGGTLTLTAGALTTGANTVIIPVAGSVSRSAGFIAGNERKQFSTGSGQSFTYDIGGPANYRPLALTNLNVTTAGTGLDATSTQANGLHANFATSGLDNTKYIQRYWSLTPQGGFAASTYDASFTFVAGDVVGADTTKVVVGKYNAGWTKPTVSNRTSTSTSISGVTTGFSDFVIGEDTTAPTFSSASMQSSTNLRIVMSEPIKAGLTLVAGDFTVKYTAHRTGATAVTQTISGISYSAANGTIDLTVPATNNSQTVTVAYTRHASNAAQRVRDESDNETATFGDQTVTNGTADTVAPSVTSAAINGTALALTLDEDLAAALALDSTAFLVEYQPTLGGAWVSQTISSVGYTNNVVTLTMASQPDNSKVVRVSYNPAIINAANRLKDAAGLETAAFTNQSVTNNTADSVLPTRTSLTTNGAGTQLTIAYDETLDGTSTPAATDFTLKYQPALGGGYSIVTSGGNNNGISSVTVNSGLGTVTLGLATAPNDSQAIRLSYVGGTNKIRDNSAAQNNAPNFTDQNVTNNTTDTVAPTLSSAVVNPAGTHLILTYSEPLDTGSTPAAGDFVVKVNGTPQANPSSVSVTSNTVDLTLAATVVFGDTVLLTYVPGVNKIRDASTAHNLAAALTDQAVTNNASGGTMQSATFNGSTVTVTWSAALDNQAVPGSQFTVRVNGNDIAGTATAVTYQNGFTETQFTLSSAIHFADVITKITYTDPGSDPRIKVSGNPATTHFITTGLVNNTPDATPSVPGSLSPASPAYTQDTTPDLTATYTDADTQDIGTLTFEICTDNSSSIACDGSQVGGSPRTSTGRTVGQSGTVTATALPNGTYYWRVKATDSGAASSAYSALRTLVVDTIAPSIDVVTPTIAGQSDYQPGSSTYFYSPAAGTQTGTLALAVDASDASGSGIASIVFPALGDPTFSGSGATINNSGSGSSGTYTFTSSNATAPSDLVITVTDKAGNSATFPVHFFRDVVAPTGGSVTYSAASQSTSTINLSTTSASDGSGAGVLTQTIKRDKGTWSSGSCTPPATFTDSTNVTITAGHDSNTSLTSGCYQYESVATDKVGNIATAVVNSNVVRIDTTPPTIDTFALGSATGSVFVSGTNVFFRPGGSGSFQVNATASDAQSGVTLAYGAAAGWSIAGSTYSYSGSPGAASATFSATNGVGTAATQGIAFNSDGTAPANGNIGTVSSFSSDGATTLSPTLFDDIAGSGIATQTIERFKSTAPYNGTSCGAFASDGTVTAATTVNVTGLTDGFCYHWVLSAVDRVGNASALSTSTDLIVDATVPTVVGSPVVQANGTTVVITYSEALGAATPSNGSYTVNGVTPTNVVVSGSSVTLTFGTAFADGIAVTVSYNNATGANHVQDAAGNLAASLSSVTATNNADTVDLAATSASISLAALDVTVNEPLKALASPSASDWAVTVNGGSPVAPSSVSAINAGATLIQLTLASPVANGDTVTVTYSGSTIKDRANLDTLTLTPSSFPVTNNTGSAPAVPTLGSGAPSDPTVSTSAHFSFTSATATSFHCQLDGGSSQVCTSPVDYTSLSDATHTFRVNATNGNGTSSDNVFQWAVNTTAPTIDSFPPSLTSSSTATFGFTRTLGANEHFECRVDAGSWATCSSPMTYNAVPTGAHQFDVSVVDGGGNRGTIVSRGWTVGAGPLAAPTITGAPDNVSNSPTAVFVFSSPNADHYECRLDTPTWTTCSSPKSYSGLSSGPHTFIVRAVDSGNNPGLITTRTWTITPYLVSTSPDDGGTISTAPANIVLTANAAVTWSGLTLEHEEEGPVAISSFSGQGTNQITIPFSATAEGLYTVTAVLNDGVNPVATVLTHFTIWIPPAAPTDGSPAPPVDAPPSAKTAPAGDADSLTSSDALTTIIWNALTVSPVTASDGVVMHTDPQPVAAASTAFGLDLVNSVEITATIVNNGVDTGTEIHNLDGVLEIVMKDPTHGAIPGVSTNGTTWTEIPELSGTTLPGGQPDGYYRNQSNGDVHVLTRHLTIFGLATGRVVLGAPGLTGQVHGNTLVLYWTPATGTIANYMAYKDGEQLKLLGNTEFQLVIPNATIGDKSQYQVRAIGSNGALGPLSAKVSGVPDLTGLSIDNAKALLTARGFQVGTVTSVISNEATGTVVGQDPWPLPVYLQLSSTVNIVVAQHGTASGKLAVRVAAARRDAVGTRPYFTARIESTLAGNATVALTRYKSIRKTYATWSKPLTAGTNYLKLPLAKNLKLPLPGIYRLTVRVKANGESKLYSIRLYLFSKTSAMALPQRATDLLVVTGPAVNDQVTQLLSGSYSIQTSDAEGVFTALPAPNETVGAVIVDATDGTGTLETIRNLHYVFPDLRIIAVVASPAASEQAKQVGAAVTVVSAPTPDATSAQIAQVLRTTLGH